MSGKDERRPLDVERLLEERARELDDGAWLAPEDARRLHDRLAREAARGSERKVLRWLAPLAAAAALLFVLVRPDGAPEAPAAIAWRALDGDGRPIESELRGGAAVGRELPAVVLELRTPPGAGPLWARVVALAEDGRRVALDGGVATALEPSASEFVRFALPPELGRDFDLCLVVSRSAPFADGLPDAVPPGERDAALARWIERSAERGLRAQRLEVSRAIR